MGVEKCTGGTASNCHECFKGHIYTYMVILKTETLHASGGFTSENEQLEIRIRKIELLYYGGAEMNERSEVNNFASTSTSNTQRQSGSPPESTLLGLTWVNCCCYSQVWDWLPWATDRISMLLMAYTQTFV